MSKGPRKQPVTIGEKLGRLDGAPNRVDMTRDAPTARGVVCDAFRETLARGKAHYAQLIAKNAWADRTPIELNAFTLMTFNWVEAGDVDGAQRFTAIHPRLKMHVEVIVEYFGEKYWVRDLGLVH